MAVVRYTAKRSLVAGVNVDDVIVKDLNPLEPYNRSREARRELHESRNFTSEALYIAGRNVWDLRVKGEASEADEIVQFLDSVEDGQVFEFAPFDASTDSPIDYRNVVATAGYTETREVATGGYTNDLKTFSFQLAEVP